MALKTRSQVADIGELLKKKPDEFTFIDPNKIAVPHTAIVNRAQIPDLSQDLMPRLGINRIMTQQVSQIQDESGPNGEPVYKALNDSFDQIRFVGSWLNSVNTAGQYVATSALGDFIEITFYGTGLNLLGFCSALTRTWDIEVDGVSTGSIGTSTNTSGIISSRSYNTNQLFNVATNLTLGTHTVRISLSVADITIYGFEVLNESTNITIPQGEVWSIGRKYTNATEQTFAYNSGFDGSSDALGTKGGRVIEYITPEGQLGKTFKAVNLTQLNLTNADHSNEEIIRKIHFREFGAGRTDDFGVNPVGITDRAFTLDDGTTTLVGDNVSVGDTGQGEKIQIQTTNEFIIFTFVGTGIDFAGNFVSSPVDIGDLYIDDVSIGKYSRHSGTIFKVASGLPYGTHTVKVVRDAASAAQLFDSFIIYGPAKPTIPEDAQEIADYNLMSDHANLAAEGRDTISNGVLRKMPTREMIYVNAGGSWAIGAVDAINRPSGFSVDTTDDNAYWETYFFGTGVDLRINSEAGNMEIEIDGSSNLSGFTTSTTGGSLSFTPATGIYSGNTGTGARITIKDMTLGLHKIRVYNRAPGISLGLDTLDIITPIHSPKNNLPANIQNTPMIGSQSISRSVKYLQETTLNQVNWCEAVGIVSTPTTTSVTLTPIQDMTCVLKTNGNPIEINFIMMAYNTTASAYVGAQIFVDGDPVGMDVRSRNQTNTTGLVKAVPLTKIQPVSAGFHIIQVMWRAEGGGVAFSDGPDRILTVKELK